MDVNSPEFDAGTVSTNETSQQSIPTANVQHGEAVGYDFSQVAAQNSSPAVVDVLVVYLFSEIHRRRIPRILTKKLESAV
jgi:hypothetical protein